MWCYSNKTLFTKIDGGPDLAADYKWPTLALVSNLLFTVCVHGVEEGIRKKSNIYLLSL